MISTIIVNYNRGDLLKKCLDSVVFQSVKDIEVIVVDNASTDESAQMIQSSYPGIRLIQNSKNLLFCKAQNQGIESAKGDFILSVNSDCILDRDYLKEVISASKLDEKIGMISGKILRMDKGTLDSTGLFLGRDRKAVERGYGRKDKGQYDNPGYVFGVSGACAFFRRNMLEDIKDENGYFDERFGMYYEDLDLCWRAQKKAWKAYYNPKALVYHARGATAIGTDCKKGSSFPRLSKELKKRYIDNRHMCMRKNDSVWETIINLPFILLYEVKMQVYLVVQNLLDQLYK